MYALEGAMQNLPSPSSEDTATAWASSFGTGDQTVTASRWRTLIVDDHAAVREMIRIILEPYSDILEMVCEAADGEQAMAQVGQHPVDLVLMDVNLPCQNGVVTTRRIKQILPNVVVLGMSVEYTPHIYNAMIAAGAVAFVRKQDAADILFKTIVYAMCTYRPISLQGNSMQSISL
jgi:DNA-binding NarL/FixJ family response regulator